MQIYSDGQKWRGTKEPLDEGEIGEWKSWLETKKKKDHGIWFHQFVANRRGKSGSSDSFYFFGFQNHPLSATADSDCSHEIKRCLLLGRKIMTNLDSILKIRHITLLTRVHIVKVIVFPVVMYRCDSWTINKAEH